MSEHTDRNIDDERLEWERREALKAEAEQAALEEDSEACPRCGSTDWSYEGDRQYCTACGLGSR